MSRQKYTRWRASDEDYDEEPEENGQLSELRDEDEREARRVFTLMTPQRESSQLTANNTIKFICIGVLMCLFCMFGGALIGFFIGFRQLNNPPNVPAAVTIPTTTTTTTTTQTPPVQPSCEDPDPFKNIPAVAMKFLPLINENRLRYYIDEITKKKPKDLANYLKNKLESLGYHVKDEVFEVSRSYSPHDEPGKVEVVYKNQSTAVLLNSTTSKFFFNGFSGNGSFSGDVVYSHYATEDDFSKLKEENVSLTNSVMLIRLGNLHPGDQVRNAEIHGAKAVFLYPDPSDFGGTNYYPSGMALPLDGVITSNLKPSIGDPATIGYTNQKGAFTLSPQNFTNIPHIPVLSISAKEANLLFKIMEGKVAYPWEGGLDEPYIYGGAFRNDSNVTAVRVTVYSDVGITSLKTVHATLPAKDTQNVVHVGVHYGSSGDKVKFSGLNLAAWLTFAEGLIKFSPNGTRRMIYLSAFPGVEGDISGGREFAELYRDWLSATGIAYVDFDNIITGKGFLQARVSPLLQRMLSETLHHVEWPERMNTSVLQGLVTKSTELEDNQHIKADYNMEPTVCGESANFGINLGISTLQLTSVNVTKSKYNLKNSQYDSLQNGLKMVDPELKWTKMTTSLLSLSSLLLSNARMPPVDMVYFARNLRNKWYNLKINSSIVSSNYTKIKVAIEAINSEFDMFGNKMDNINLWYKGITAEKDQNHLEIQREMDRLQGLKYLQRAFLRSPAVPSPTSDGRLLTYGPDVNDSCSGTYFPMAKKVFSEILAGKKQWEDLHREFSLILSALSGLNRMPFLNT